jgi:hypothetical protein
MKNLNEGPMNKQNIEERNELPETVLLVRGKNADRKWTQEVIHEYSDSKGTTFQEVVWEILFVAASRLELEMQKNVRK